MNRQTFENLVETANNRRLAITRTKGREYIGAVDDDFRSNVLANFERVAERLELDPKVIWAVYTQKHIDSIMTFVAGKTGNPVESIVGRLDDVRNYCDLLEAMLHDYGLVEIDGQPMDYDPFVEDYLMGKAILGG